MNGIDKREAKELLACEGSEIVELLARANSVRLETRGRAVLLCGILNAKSGHCTEDCKFCSQSDFSDSNVECYPLMDAAKMVGATRIAQEQYQTVRFGIVTSGVAIEENEDIQTICDALRQIRSELRVLPCASLGNVSRDALVRLKEAGLTRYHCNLETSERFYPEICTTRSWQESVDTVRMAREIGLTVCSGGLFGLGESQADRVDLLATLREMDVESVPLNFFHPVPGTRLPHVNALTPLECLKIIAVTRLMMPNKEIRVCGGREYNLRDLQSWMLASGVDGFMVGGYLTTTGRSVADDLRMVEDAGYVVKLEYDNDGG